MKHKPLLIDKTSSSEEWCWPPSKETMAEETGRQAKGTFQCKGSKGKRTITTILPSEKVLGIDIPSFVLYK